MGRTPMKLRKAGSRLVRSMGAERLFKCSGLNLHLDMPVVEWTRQPRTRTVSPRPCGFV